MENQLSLHLKNFNNRVKVMNQTNARELILSKLEAQNIHADIFELLTQIQALAEVRDKEVAESVIKVSMDGGGF